METIDLEIKNLIKELAERFRDSIPEGENQLVIEFEKYLYSTVTNMQNSDSPFIRKDIDSIKSLLMKITDVFISYELNVKKQYLLLDESFEKIGKISGKIYKIAQGILNGNEISVDVDEGEKINELNDLLKDVADYNMEQAKLLVSEAKLDIKFIKNPDTNILSLRLANIKNNIKKQTIRRKDNGKGR